MSTPDRNLGQDRRKGYLIIIPQKGLSTEQRQLLKRRRPNKSPNALGRFVSDARELLQESRLAFTEGLTGNSQYSTQESQQEPLIGPIEGVNPAFPEQLTDGQIRPTDPPDDLPFGIPPVEFKP